MMISHPNKLVQPHLSHRVGCYWLAAALGLASACQPDQPHQVPAATMPLAATPAPAHTTSLSATSPPDTTAPARIGPALAMAPRTLSPQLHQLIKANFARINAEHDWSAIWEEPLEDGIEGGTATYYDFNGQLWKIAVRRYGETGQARTEYYLWHGQPSFVLEREYHYNRPMYYNAAAMRENHDTEAFNFKKSTIETSRSYFDEAGRLVAQVGPMARDSAAVAGYLAREQLRLRDDLDTLRQLGLSNRRR